MQKVHKLFLSRRNLLTLLSKLDRKAQGETTQCTIIKTDDMHEHYAQTMPQILVQAVEDIDYYTDREPGPVHPRDTPK